MHARDSAIIVLLPSVPPCTTSSWCWWVHDDSARALSCDAGVVVGAWQTERYSCADAVYMYGEWGSPYMYGEWGSPWVHDDSARALACDAGVVVGA